MTPFALSSFSDLKAHAFDSVIDVRAPSEFAQDHLPGAINLPVLSDDERARVGTIYAQQSPFDARKIGGALVARNTAQHLQEALTDKAGDWQPLVYCWRGGQRSGAFATILSQVGWRVQLLQGGYRSYRRLIVQSLYKSPLSHRIQLIAGGTGTAKTALLQHLRKAGAQVLDLECLAHHRGSLFGGHAGAQPSQKMFESRLAGALAALDPHQITWIEAESSKVGARLLPPSLWSAMRTAPRIAIMAPLAERAAYLCRAYGDLTEDPAALHAQIDRLRPFHSADQIAQWHGLASTSDWPALAEGLIYHHYDQRYEKAAAHSVAAPRAIALSDLEENTLKATAQRLITEFR